MTNDNLRPDCFLALCANFIWCKLKATNRIVNCVALLFSVVASIPHARIWGCQLGQRLALPNSKHVPVYEKETYFNSLYNQTGGFKICFVYFLCNAKQKLNVSTKIIQYNPVHCR